jgi:hypothetical protein
MLVANALCWFCRDAAHLCIFVCIFIFSGGYIILATRHELVQNNEIYKNLEPLMDKLETNRKWKKMSRDVFPGFNLKKDGIIWCYQVLDK